jgi:tRNA (mo5U34)-methyltransferase
LSELAALREEVSAVNWYHSIDLGNGIVTPGTPVNQAMLEHGLPDLAGRSVLDIGAWDGFYSFVAEQRGARRVVALDHYAWLVDFTARNRYWAECDAAGILPDPARDLSEFAHPDTLPGRRGFDLAHRVLDSAVEPVVADFMDVGTTALGKFDVVMFLGVLYHVRDPLAALERVRAVTDGVAVIETEAIEVLGMPTASLLSFTEGAQLRHDHTNWFVPTRAALSGMCLAAGFTRVETRIGPPSGVAQLKGAVRRAAHAMRARRGASRLGTDVGLADTRFGTDVGLADIPFERYRITVHAFT